MPSRQYLSQLRNPIAHRARSVFRRALRKGTIVPKPCEECGEKAFAHHEDYHQPLVVKWLCRKHHYELHEHYKRLGYVIPGGAEITPSSVLAESGRKGANARAANLSPERRQEIGRLAGIASGIVRRLKGQK